MIKILLLFCLVSIVVADLNGMNDKNLNLYKYDPTDVYSLPEDINERPAAVIFTGNVMKARTEKLESFSGKDKFKLDLRTQNGIQVSSVGKLKDDKKTFVVSGSYSFTGANGKRYRTRYTADEFGYHPITELDIDAKPSELNTISVPKKAIASNQKNRFQFLNQNLNNQPNRGSGQSGDDYSYETHQDSGYDYRRPSVAFDTPATPDRQYLPAN